jgi:tetratricopeptide (TPR) repeat protein
MDLASWALMLSIGGAPSCGPTGIEPVGLASRDSVERDVLTLIDSSTEIVLRDAADPEAHRRLAWSFEANGFWDEAARSYDSVLKLDAKDHLSRLHRSIALGEIGRDDEALAELEKAAAALPDIPAVQFRLGLARLEVGRLDDAKRCFEVVLARLPDAPHAPYGLGRVAQARGKPEIARTYFERALKAAPGESRILFALGQTYQALGREDLAKTYLTRGAGGSEIQLPDPFGPNIEEFARSRTARLERASRLRSNARFDQALAVVGQILADDPTDEIALTCMTQVLIEADRHEEAAKVIDEHLRQNPDAAQAHYHLSMVLCARGEATQAVRAARRAVELAPDLMPMRKQYGVALAQSGAYSDAYFQISEAVRLGANEAAMQRELARLCLLQKLPDMAAEHLRAALEIDPLDPIVHLNLIIALGDAGRADEARQAFAAMGRAVPNHRAVDKAVEYLESRGIR